MNAESHALLPPSIPWNADVDQSPAEGEQLPELGGAAMAEEGTPLFLRARKHGCHPEAGPGETSMPNRIDTPVNSVQAAFLDAVRNRARGESRRKQLPGRDDAVLPRGDRCHRELRSGSFLRHRRVKEPGPGFLPMAVAVQRP